MSSWKWCSDCLVSILYCRCGGAGKCYGCGCKSCRCDPLQGFNEYEAATERAGAQRERLNKTIEEMGITKRSFNGDIGARSFACDFGDIMKNDSDLTPASYYLNKEANERSATRIFSEMLEATEDRLKEKFVNKYMKVRIKKWL